MSDHSFSSPLVGQKDDLALGESSSDLSDPAASGLASGSVPKQTSSASTTDPCVQFCENYAKSVALDFAQAWFNFVTDDNGNDHVTSIDERRVSELFVHTFQSCFESEARRICCVAQPAAPTDPAGASSSDATRSFRSSMPPLDRSFEHDTNEDVLSSDHEHAVHNGFATLSRHGSGKKKRRSKFLRRFPSLKEMKNSIMSATNSAQRHFSSTALNVAHTGEPTNDTGFSATLNGGHAREFAPPEIVRSSKPNHSKTVVEVIREGQVRYVSGRNLETKSWQKCRMVLLKAAGGHMLEFYCPPKSSKPRSGLFCLLITEARQCTALETPDHENTFVVKAEHEHEYVMEARSAEDAQQWLHAIAQCMTQPTYNHDHSPPTQPKTHCVRDFDGSTSVFRRHNRASAVFPLQHNANRPTSVHPTSTTASAVTEAQAAALSRSLSTGRNARHRSTAAADDTAILSSSVSTRSLHTAATTHDVLHNTNNAAAAAASGIIGESLFEYPWFHGSLARQGAATLVLQTGNDGHGLFLVRQSETRRGEFVLTFNCFGRAKHLRLTIDRTGQCHVQRLWFSSVLDMLEYFRQHPIPLDTQHNQNAAAGGVLLTEYVIMWPPSSGVLRTASPVTIDARDYMTHSGSVRLTIASLEQMFYQQSAENPVWTTVRAENAYHYT